MREIKNIKNIGDVIESVSTTFTPIGPVIIRAKDSNIISFADTKIILICNLVKVRDFDFGCKCGKRWTVSLEQGDLPFDECCIYFEDEEVFVFLPNVQRTLAKNTGICHAGKIVDTDCKDEMEAVFVMIEKEACFRNSVKRFLNDNSFDNHEL